MDCLLPLLDAADEKFATAKLVADIIFHFTAAASSTTPIAYGLENTESQTGIGGLLHALTPQAMASDADGIHYFVSTDNGTTWNEVTLNELEQLQRDDYRIKFKITMNEVSGSTPVLDSYQLAYGGYVSGSQQSTVLDLEVANSVSTVQINTNFSSTVEAVDAIGFKVPTHSGTATLELIDSATNSVTSGLNQNSAAIVNGTVTLTGLQINKTGTFRIRATDGANTADSAVLTVTSTATLISPELNFSAVKYSIKSGENTDLRWNSQNLKAFTLNPGNATWTNFSGTYRVSPTQTTTYSLRGTGDYGEITSNLTIFVSGSIETTNTATASATAATSPSTPTQNLEGEANQLKKDPSILKVSPDVTVIKGQKVTVSWEAVGVDRVYVDYVGEDVSALGSFEFYPVQTTNVTITAYKGDQIYQEVITITVIEAPVVVQQVARTLQEISPTSAGVVTKIVQIAQGVPSVVLGILLTLQTILSGLLLAGIVAQSSLAALNKTTVLDILHAIGVLPYKKRKGFVHDAKSGKPVPFATISVFEKIGNKKTLCMTLTSDIRGTYREPYLPKGTYVFEVRHQEYSFPTKQSRPAHMPIANFYTGEEIVMSAAKTQLSLLIPMDVVNVTIKKTNTWELLGYRASLTLSRALIVSHWILYPLAALSALAVVLSPSILNILVGIIYTAMVARQLHARSSIRNLRS